MYYEFDAQGSVSQRLDASGNVLSSSAYDAYGAETNSGTPSDPFGYNAQWGYWLDRDTGLYLCQARWYDPVTARWVTRDPIGYSGGANLYGYCGGGPVGWADPWGLLTLSTGQIASISPIGGMIALFYGGGDFEFTAESFASGMEVSAAAAAVVATETGAEIANGAIHGGVNSMLYPGPLTGWDGGDYQYDAGFVESTRCWDTAQHAGSAALHLRLEGLNAFVGKYPRSGGGGITVTKDGKRVFGVDVHPWTEKGSRTSPRRPAPWWKWPHIHKGPRVKDHWPWE